MMSRPAFHDCHIAIVLAGLSAGGAERVIAQLAGQWHGVARRVTVIAFDSPDEPIYHPLPSGVRVHRLAVGGRGPKTILRRVSALRTFLTRERPDILVSFLTKINVIALVASIGTQVPVVVAERNNPEQQNAHWIWNAALRVLYGRAAAIVCQTAGSMRCIPQAYRGRTVVIPNPVTAYPVQPVGTGSMRLTAVGRLTPQKGFDLLIDAFSLVAPHHPEWILDIWGEGSDRKALERRAASLGLAEKVCFRGVSAEPGGWIRDSTAFVLSSRFEGFPNVLSEAMAAGLPVVATRCDFGPEEIVVDQVTGLLVAPSVAALASGLDRILGQPNLRAQLGTAARSIEADFSIDAVTALWLRTLSRLRTH
jgi:glycosyltransferase involved in cell wall biosynthesis